MGDDQEFMEQAFAVELDANELVDLNSMPSSGLEYLKRVILEARQCEEIKVAKFENKFQRDKDALPIVTTQAKEVSPNEFCPSIRWQQEQEREFSNIRQKFELYRSNSKKKVINYKLPQRDDEKAWRDFCYGGVKNEQGHPPLISIVAGFNQPLVHKLLQHHSEWMKTQPFSLDLGRWLYSLLVCLEKPLDPDTCSMLRDIARTCAATRSEMESAEDDRLGSLNLIICLIARYFDQKDLADDKP